MLRRPLCEVLEALRPKIVRAILSPQKRGCRACSSQQPSGHGLNLRLAGLDLGNRPGPARLKLCAELLSPRRPREGCSRCAVPGCGGGAGLEALLCLGWGPSPYPPQKRGCLTCPVRGRGPLHTQGAHLRAFQACNVAWSCVEGTSRSSKKSQEAFMMWLPRRADFWGVPQ